MNDHEVLTVEEAAKVLRISRNHAYGLVAQDKLPSIRLGRRIRIPRDLFDNWMKHQQTGDDDE